MEGAGREVGEEGRVSWKKGADRKYIYQTCTRVRLCTKIQTHSKHDRLFVS